MLRLSTTKLCSVYRTTATHLHVVSPPWALTSSSTTILNHVSSKSYTTIGATPITMSPPKKQSGRKRSKDSSSKSSTILNNNNSDDSSSVRSLLSEHAEYKEYSDTLEMDKKKKGRKKSTSTEPKSKDKSKKPKTGGTTRSYLMVGYAKNQDGSFNPYSERFTEQNIVARQLGYEDKTLLKNSNEANKASQQPTVQLNQHEQLYLQEKHKQQQQEQQQIIHQILKIQQNETRDNSNTNPSKKELIVKEEDSSTVIESLYKITQHNDIPNLGSVAFVGFEDSGKSTIIESLIGIRLFDKDVHHYRTVSVTCVRTRGETYFEFLEGGWRNSGKLYNIEDVRKRLAELNPTNHIYSAKEMLSMAPVEILYAAPHLHNIRLIDFPSLKIDPAQRGLLIRASNAVSNVMSDIPQGQRIIAFCTEPSRGLDNDIGAIHGLDPSFQSTFGILTKLDKFVEPAVNIISNQTYLFKNGWLGFCGNQDINNDKSAEQDREQQEKDSFLLRGANKKYKSVDNDLLESINNNVKENIENQYNIKLPNVGPKALWNKIFNIYLRQNRNEVLNILTKSMKHLQLKTTNVITSIDYIKHRHERADDKYTTNEFFKSLTHPNSKESIAMNLLIKKNLEYELIRRFDDAIQDIYKPTEKEKKTWLPIIRKYQEENFLEKFNHLASYLNQGIPIKKSDAVAPIDTLTYSGEFARMVYSPSLNSESLFNHLRHNIDHLGKSTKLILEKDTPNTSSLAKQLEFERWNGNYRHVISRIIKRRFDAKVPGIILLSLNQIISHDKSTAQSIEQYYLTKNGEEIAKNLDTNIFMHQIYKEQTPSITFEEFRSVLKEYYNDDVNRKPIVPFSLEWTQIYFRAVAIKIANDIFKCALHNMVIPNIVQSNQSIQKFEASPYETMRKNIVSLEKEMIPKEEAIETIKTICDLKNIPYQSNIPKISEAHLKIKDN